MMIAAALLALALRQTPEEELARKCDSQIPWIADGTELIDMELAKGHHPQYPEAREPRNYKVDRAALLAKARALAIEKGRMILWYCPRVSGLHMYRAILPDRYMKAVAFTDPGVVDLITAKFVPLRMCADAEIGAELGVKAFEFVEPGFILLSPEGKVVRRIDRLRTFNADWIRAALVASLREHPEYNRPAGDSVDALIRGGDDEKAFERASVDQKALILRRQGKFEDVLRLECSGVHQGLALLGLQRFEEARRRLEGEKGPEAAYGLAGIDAWTGKDPSAHLRAVLRNHPDSPWAWRAAANLVRAEDSLPQGPLAHHLEDFFLRPPIGVPESTRLPAPNGDVAARRALEFLLRSQWEDGSWRDARYAYWPDPKILPNVWTAVTGLAALALVEWRGLAPERVDAAVRRADAYLRDPGHTAPDQHEESYAHGFRLHYFARLKDTAAMAPIVTRLGAMQDREGFWCHEYQNPFSTAAVVHALAVARSAGADVPEVLFRRASGALLSTRGDQARQAYRVGEAPDNEKSTSSRSALCEMALVECGRKELADVMLGVDRYWTFAPRAQAVRLCDYHSDGRLAGFFYFHAAFHTLEATRTLEGAARADSLRRFRESVLAIPEWDGSFVDSHEIGKSYGTAVALILLARSKE
jgi:hypothetical protein